MKTAQANPETTKVATRCPRAPALLTVEARSPSGVGFRAEVRPPTPATTHGPFACPAVEIFVVEPLRSGGTWSWSLCDAEWNADACQIDDVPLTAWDATGLDAAEEDVTFARLSAEIARGLA